MCVCRGWGGGGVEYLIIHVILDYFFFIKTFASKEYPHNMLLMENWRKLSYYHNQILILSIPLRLANEI